MASGMITADVGLVEVPHVTAPAGLEELSASLAPVLVPDVCPLPIHFIPGVKNRVSGVSLETFEAMDIMRGEEVEACALIDRLGVRGRRSSFFRVPTPNLSPSGRTGGSPAA